MNETIEFIAIKNRLSNLYPRLMNYAATAAVNFFKERFVLGQDINGTPFKPRSKKVWGKQRPRDSSKKSGRATLVDTARLKRDVQKIYVSENSALLGTTRLTAPYAQANNEGFKGTVSQTVKAHDRRRFKRGIVAKKQLKTKTNITFGKVQTGTVRVRSHSRKINQNIPQRQFMGNSSLLDRRIERVITAEIIRAIKG